MRHEVNVAPAIQTPMQQALSRRSQGRLLADDGGAPAFIRRWLATWAETDTGRRWAEPLAKAARR